VKKAKRRVYLGALLALLFIGFVVTLYVVLISSHDAKLESMTRYLASRAHPPGTQSVTTHSEIGIIDTGNWDRCDYYVGECRRTKLEPDDVRDFYNGQQRPSSEYSMSVFFFGEQESENNYALGQFRHPDTWGLRSPQDSEWRYYIVSVFDTSSRALDHRCY
jgi:hypothetical protein